MADYNPIRSVNGKAVKCPSGYKYSLNDISASDAGRTEDTNMDKKRIGQCVKLEMDGRMCPLRMLPLSFRHLILSM